MKTYRRNIFILLIGLAGFLGQNVCAQTIMFDDFTYSGVTDGQLSAFNKWSIIQGTSGPPEGGQYRSDNITFITDPANANNKLMTLSTTVNGQSKATTHARIETNGFEYFEGTYAARVYFSDVPYTYKDGNVQTFYTIVSSSLGTDGSKYSELDFEYMAADKWGISPDNKVLYLTSWNRYIADPWQAWKRYFSYQQSYAGWHTFTVSCTDGVNVKYWIDNSYQGAMSTTDNDGTSVYPRSPMQIAFANWIWNNVVGTSTSNRTTTMQVDWVLFSKNQELTPQQVETQVATYRAQGLQRRNLAGNTYVTTPNPNQSPVVNLTAPANAATFTAPASITLSATASDSDGSIAKVEFFNGATSLGSDTSSPYSMTWANVAAGSYSITAVATDNAGATATSAAASITVTGSTSPNLALNKPVTVSSVETATLTGPAAVDGNSATRWASLYTDPQWIYVDLGGNYAIQRVRLNWEAAYASAYRIEVSSDAASWNSIYSTTTGNGGVDDLTGLTGSGRYVRVYGTTRASEWGYSLWDFEVYGTPATGNNAPTVSLTVPGSAYTAPATINLSATASDSDGTIAQVAFYNGNQLLGTDNSSPYSYTWSNVAAGSYAVKAIATDNGGATATSTSVNITVTNPSSAFDLLIQAESFGNMGGVTLEPTTDAGGGQNVAYIDTEDWMAYYNITIPTSGNYTVQYRVASLSGGGRLSLDLNGGATVLGTQDISSTGGWQTWTTVSHTVFINAGTYNFGIYAQTGGWNINWWRITSASPAAASTASTAEASTAAAAIKLYPNPSSKKIQVTAPYDLEQAAVEIQDAEGFKVFEGVYGPAGIDISQFKRGVYLMKIRKGNIKTDLRFIKE